MTQGWPKYEICEICGKPATIMIRDTEPDFNMRDKGVNAKVPSDSVHYFCEKHKQNSQHFDMNEWTLL